MAMNPRLLRPTRTASAGTDPYFSSVSLLLHMDGANGSTTFTDSSASPKTVTANGNAQISTAQSKFGGASGLFDGNGSFLDGDADFLSVSAPFTSIGSIDGDYTIECWVYFLTTPPGMGDGNERQIVGQHSWPEGSGNWWTLLALSGGLVLYASDNDGVDVVLSDTFSWSSGQWYHVAVTRSQGTVWMFVDGTPVNSGTSATKTLIADDVRSLTIGAAENGLTPLNGYIDDLRITKGVGRYTAAFTPPTAPFPNG